jgi:hypothetical protein
MKNKDKRGTLTESMIWSGLPYSGTSVRKIKLIIFWKSATEEYAPPEGASNPKSTQDSMGALFSYLPIVKHCGIDRLA